MGVDSHEQVGFVPIDGVAEDVAFARARGVEPEAEEAVFPDGGGGIVGAGDQCGMGGADGLTREGLGDPGFAQAAIVDSDVGIFAVEFVGAEFSGDARAGGLLGFVTALTETEHDE